MISRVREAFGRVDNWLLTRHPDLWMSRVHYLLVGYPVLVVAVTLMTYLVPVRTSKVPGDLDGHASYIFLVLAILAGTWMYWVGRQQSDTPIRVRSRGWTTPLRSGLGLLILMSLPFPYIRAMHARIGNLVDDEQFLQDNLALRHIDLRIASRSSGDAFTRRLGLVIGQGTPTGSAASATSEQRDAWVRAVTTYSTLDAGRARQFLDDYAMLERQTATGLPIDDDLLTFVRSYEQRFWNVIENLEHLAHHKGYGTNSSEDLEEPGLWIYLGLFALYLGFFSYMVTQISRTVATSFWIGVALVIVAGSTAVLFALEKVDSASSSDELYLATMLMPYFLCGGVVLHTWITQRSTGIRKGALFLFCALTPLALFTVWFVGLIGFDWRLGIDGNALDDFDETWEITKFAAVMVVAYFAVLPPLQRIVNRIRALPR